MTKTNQTEKRKTSNAADGFFSESEIRNRAITLIDKIVDGSLIYDKSTLSLESFLLSYFLQHFSHSLIIPVILNEPLNNESEQPHFFG